MSTRIADYGIIGNCRSSALVSKTGSIDWACFPDFDSTSPLCKILDESKGGFFSISPEGYYQSSQIYRDKTNILKTDFFNHTGRIVLTDFMPLTKEEENENKVPEFGLKIIRRIRAKKGNHSLSLELKLTPDFARGAVEISLEEDRVKFTTKDSNFYLYCPGLTASFERNTVRINFEVREGEEKFFGFGFYDKDSSGETFDNGIAGSLYEKTANFWLWWSSLIRYRGIFEKEVTRSALALKLLIFSPTGAVVAAPTTSLPEKLGGGLNWDYRYVWLRDAAFTMYALLGLGYLKEALEFMSWLERVCLAEENDIQIMYGIRGEKDLHEEELGNLAGYENSSPVRIGNGAHGQKQLDVYGEVLNCINLFINSGGKLSPGMKGFIIRLVETCSLKWQEKDAGIWEPRGGEKHHTYSKLMCWVGMDRGIALVKQLDLKVDLPRWQETANAIKADIIKNGYNKDLGAFVDFYGSDTIDSSNLNIPLVGFLPADDPTVLSTLNVSMSRLTHDWFVYRTNDQADQLKVGEGTFFLSSFWVVDTLSSLGRVKEAKIWLEKLIYFSSPLGLYGEQYDPETGKHLGNFPQAFTHLGLINSVLNLKAAIKFGPEKQATILAERLKRASLFRLENALELFIPSRIREKVYPKEKRRTIIHSLAGRIVHKFVK